jgi:hypothetical protein
MLIASFIMSNINYLFLGVNYPDIASYIGFSLGQIFPVVGISFILSGIIGLIYWLIKKEIWKDFYITIWVFWGMITAISTAGIIMQYFDNM